MGEMFFDVSLGASLSVALPDLAFRCLAYIREDPCRLVPMWERDPEKFFLEFGRWSGGVHGFVTEPQGEPYSSTYGAASPSQSNASWWHQRDAGGDVGEFNPRYFSIAAAQLDGRVFRDPYKFDPAREDLNKTITFNTLEKDWKDAVHAQGHVGPGSATLGRYCPGRGFAIKWATEHLPRYFPDLDGECANSQVRFAGVDFAEVTMRLPETNTTLQVFTAVEDGSAAFWETDALVIAVHGYPTIPQSFGPVLSGLRGKGTYRWSMWAPTLPGLRKDDGFSEYEGGLCTIAAAADVIRSLVKEARRSHNWDRVLLLGHGTGGSIAWAAASELDTADIDQLVVMNAPHPAVTFARMAASKTHVDQTHFGGMLRPLVNMHLNKPEVLAEVLENTAPWFTLKWKREMMKAWRAAGSHALSCYFRDTYTTTADGTLMPANVDIADYKAMKPHMHILMVGGGLDLIIPREAYLETAYFMGRTKGKHFDIHVVPEAGHLDILHDATFAENVADRISTFVLQTDRIHLSLWSTTHPPMLRTGGFVEDERYAMSIPVMVFFTFVLISFGLALEVTVGPMMIVLSESHEKNMVRNHGAVGMMGSRNTLYTFCKLLMGPLVFSSLISGSWSMAVPFTLGLWHVGFPELTSSFVEAWTGRPYGWIATAAEAGSDASPPARSAAKQARMQRALTSVRGADMRSDTTSDYQDSVIAAVRLQSWKARQLRLWSAAPSTNGEEEDLDLSIKLSNGMRALEMWLFTAFLIHHIGATVIFTANCTGSVPAEILIFGAIANGLQHATSFLAFANNTLFMVVLLLCEVWMQLEFFYAMPVTEAWPQLGVWFLIVSHWMFLIEALYGMLAGHRDAKTRLTLIPDDQSLRARKSATVPARTSSVRRIEAPGDMACIAGETRRYSAAVHTTSGPEDDLELPTLPLDQPSEVGEAHSNGRSRTMRPSTSDWDWVPDHHLTVV